VGVAVHAGVGECPQGPPPLLVVPDLSTRVCFHVISGFGGCGGYFCGWVVRARPGVNVYA